jgi:signal transduction histidine kinase/ligand-binding sensor domain-containing protein
MEQAIHLAIPSSVVSFTANQNVCIPGSTVLKLRIFSLRSEQSSVLGEDGKTIALPETSPSKSAKYPVRLFAGLRSWFRRTLVHLVVRTCVRWAFLVLIFSSTSAVCGAQYRFDMWTAENGLPQSVIKGIAQTPDGYLWIATLDGLARFDGVRFSVFNKNNSLGIASNRFSSMVQGADGDLWLMSEGGALTRYHRGAFHTYGAQDGLPANSVRAITGDESGSLWILSGESILQWGISNGQLVDVTPTNLRLHYEPLLWENGGFWAWDPSGLNIFSEGRFVHYPLPAWLPGNSIWAVGTAKDGSVWLEKFDGTQGVIRQGQQETERIDLRHPRGYSYHDAHGHTWTIHVEAHLSRLLDLESSGGVTSIPLDWFLEDREGNVWVGTEGKGLYRLQKPSILVYSKAEGLIDNNIYPIYQDSKGAIWIGAWPSGLSQYINGRFINYTVAQGLPGPRISALTEDHEGRLWVATRVALAVFHEGHFQKPAGIVLPEHAVVQAMIVDRGGTLWIGTSSGMVLYRDGPSKTLTVQDGLATNDVRVIVEGRSGDIWIGGYGGLTQVHGGQFTRWTEREGLPSDNIRAIYEDADGAIWIGTYDGGLGRLKDGKLTRYRESEGLFNNGVFQILEDGRGNFWMSSNKGIYRVSKQELNAFADGKLPSIVSVAYGKSDGMANVECNGGMWPAGIRTRDSKLWFPTQGGVAIVDPQTVRINPQAPPVEIEAALIDRTPVPVNSSLRMQPGKENLEIEYTALSFVHSDQIRFRYKMESLDSRWVDAGARRTAYYSHLPPGKYQFRVIARNSDGVWNAEGRKLAVEVLAPFYRTWWFAIVEVIGLVALILLAARQRIRQLQKREALQKAFSQQLIASQESERQRIAAELHDSLGQRLVVINNLALLSMRAQAKAGQANHDEDALKEISEEAASAIQETREISYNLRPFQLDRLGLTKAVEGILRSVGSASGLRITSEMANIDDALPEELRINFYRIVQEALNNIMKHARATEIQVRINRTREHLTLSVRDNGIGFTPGGRPTKVGKSGFGLTGMEERTHLLGGEFRVSSAPGDGATLTIEIPIGTNGRR